MAQVDGAVESPIRAPEEGGGSRSLKRSSAETRDAVVLGAHSMSVQSDGYSRPSLRRYVLASLARLLARFRLLSTSVG